MSSATGETHTFEDPKGKWWWEYHDSEYGEGPQDKGGPHDTREDAFQASREWHSPSMVTHWPHGSKGMFGNDLFEHRPAPWEGAKKEASMTTSVKKVAHDSGDGQTVYHCPFCGSGQVLARSDRTIECEFCHTAFTVQVQPEFAAFPQTVNGMPMDVPGMPGQVGGGMGGPPVDPDAVGEDGSVMAQGDPMASDADATEENEQGQDEDNPDAAANPFTSKLYRTEAGALLSEDDFLAHMAIRFSPNPRATAAMVKASRKQAASDDLPEHLQEYWGNRVDDPRDQPHFCVAQSKKTPAIPWHNVSMKYDNGVPQHNYCHGCRKNFPVNPAKDGWGAI
jgi:hypothetical protein